MSRKRKTLEEGSFTFRFTNSIDDIKPPAKQGTVRLDEAMRILTRLTIAAGLAAQGHVYQRKAREIRAAVRDTILARGAKWAASKALIKTAISKLARIWEAEKAAGEEMLVEESIRLEGFQAMRALLKLRLRGHRSTKTKTFWTRRGAKPIEETTAPSGPKPAPAKPPVPPLAPSTKTPSTPQKPGASVYAGKIKGQDFWRFKGKLYPFDPTPNFKG